MITEEKAILADSEKAAFMRLLLQFSMVDGHFQTKELTVVRRLCADLGIEPKTIEEECRLVSPDFSEAENRCKELFKTIVDAGLREKALQGIAEITEADDHFDERERLVLAVLSEELGPPLKKLLTEHAWDEQQSTVIRATADRRIEVHAGPGMGKTAVACAKVSQLIDQGVEASNIWLLSFTRTAVQEIRDRIESFAQDSHSVLGVKIGTIDSRAWRLRCGFSDGDVEDLFGGYDASIQSVIDLIRNEPREIREFLESIEHVIVDEAQDITSVRAQLIAELLRLLPDSCGVTVFADPAQAIYGWTTDGDGVQPEDRVNLLDLIGGGSCGNFETVELRSIYRTDVPNLIELMEELRLDIYVNDHVDLEGFKQRRTLIAEHANERLGDFSANELAEYQNALVLFRRRSEVLLASSFANSEGIRHRIRMSGLPPTIFPWIGQLLANYPGSTISEQDFQTRWREQEYYVLRSPDDITSGWQRLFALGHKGGVVRIDEIRKKLARRPPDIDCMVPDLGISGPIIGTIHASKGREADEVILRLPSDVALPRDGDLDEESRVLFVGASRAKSKLSVGNGFLKESFASSLEGRRVFRKMSVVGKYKFPSALVEFGRDGDIDPYSFVSKGLHSQVGAIEIQRVIARLASKAPMRVEAHLISKPEFKYQLWTVFDGDLENPGQFIGAFNSTLNMDLFQTLNRISDQSSRFRPPNLVNNLYVVGASTFSAPLDDPRLVEVHDPFRRTGMWLVPVVTGYPRVNFIFRNRGRRN